MMTLDDLSMAESLADRTARLRAQRLSAAKPIPAVGTSDYIQYRATTRPVIAKPPVKAKAEPPRVRMALPPLGLLPECPITGNRYATHKIWMEALWSTGLLDTMDIAEIVGGRTTEAEVCRALAETREVP